jgi:hypothetical protein
VRFWNPLISLEQVGFLQPGATSASLSGQKAAHYPKLRVSLTKLQGTAASDAMGSISVEMFKAFRSQAASLSSGKFSQLQKISL